ncbi:MAG TPA: hypothetical protein VFG86_12465 [Chloroflexota bacterium]|nr:hypothetical protein [Chloroflexota bacterium]
MDIIDRSTMLRLEQVRSAWEFASAELQMHEHRYIQLFALCLTFALTALASIAIEKVTPAPGLSVASTMTLGAGYANLRLVQLPSQLRRAYDARQHAIETLMGQEEG